MLIEISPMMLLALAAIGDRYPSVNVITVVISAFICGMVVREYFYRLDENPIT